MNDDRRLFEELLAENTELHKDRIPCGISRKRIAQKTAFLTGLGIKQTWAPLRRADCRGLARRLCRSRRGKAVRLRS